MTEFARIGDFAYQVQGQYIPRTKTFSVELLSSYDAAKSNTPRRITQLNLSKDELTKLIQSLEKIASDIPA